jgi:DNA topoisomerase-1
MAKQLIICEKPSAAMKVAYALGEGGVKRVGGRFFPAFSLKRGPNQITVVSALGHLYALDQQSIGWSYPVFDIRWVPINEVERRMARVKAWIGSIAKHAEGVDEFVSACDYDTEGSLIAFNILRYACRGADAKARRMRFSTLTKQDLVAAYEGMSGELDIPVIEAGRARHELDWIFGVNVSRALMDSQIRAGGGYEVLSAGRVQSPTLYALYRRENGIRLHVPDPYWVIEAEAEIAGERVPAEYAEGRVLSLREAEGIARRCNGAEGAVSRVAGKRMVIPPPAPFDLGVLQSEAYRHFGFSPSRTQKMAEKLYLDALISYPRTSSQRLPPSLGYARILEGLRKNRHYAEAAGELLLSGRQLRPREGKKVDPAHPAVHPTGNAAEGLGRDEFRVYDLIVKRFLAAFAEDAVKEVTDVEITCGGRDRFLARGEAVLSEGWVRFYAPYSFLKEVELPKVSEGDPARMASVSHEERYTEPPPRFNQSSIIKFMEKNGLGTKSTRADIVDTLYRRGYIEGGMIEVTALGAGVIAALRRHFPKLVSIGLTRGVEAGMEEIEGGKRSREEVLAVSIDEVRGTFERMISGKGGLGEGLADLVKAKREGRRTVGQCPSCKTGRLTIIRSKKSGKRFIGCSGYSSGCRFTAPLPQRGRISTSKRVCKECGYPIVEVRGLGRYVWRLCINVECPTKRGREKRGGG